MATKSLDRAVVEAWAQEATTRGLLAAGRLAEAVVEACTDMVFPRSLASAGEDALLMARVGGRRALAVFGPNVSGFKGIKASGGMLRLCPLDARNARRLRKILPFTAPRPLRDQPVTFGVGDRLGIASPGHLRLFHGRAAAPVLAQQSVRELDLTARTYEEVMDAACWAVFQEGYRAPWGADGDHLKTATWVRKAVKLGFTMITADVADYIRGQFGSAEEEAVMDAYRALPERRRGVLEDRYLGLRVALDNGEEVGFVPLELARIALVYGEALDHAVTLYNAARSGHRDFDFELSIDETMTPTLPAAHVFVATEMKERGIPLFSLAPRFIGEFQKGIDYIGDAAEFERSFTTHAAIARHFGYRISVHSGSDKFTVFPIVGRLTKQHFHLKTAGTNWLQGLEVICLKSPDFFRRLWTYALEVFPAARKYYHITPNMENLPKTGGLADDKLEVLLENPDSRQILHVTYGEMLRNAELRGRIYDLLEEHIEAYWESLERHIGRHLDTLGVDAR